MSFPTPAQLSSGSTPLPAAGTNNMFTGRPATPSSAALPNPSVFDVLPLVHELVSRILLSEAASSQESGAVEDTLATYSNQSPININQLAGEMSSVRNRLRKARAAVEDLPDVERDLQEQEDEIQELKERVDKQRRVLDNLVQKF